MLIISDLYLQIVTSAWENRFCMNYCTMLQLKLMDELVRLITILTIMTCYQR